MKASRHLKLLSQGVAVWAAFWLAGLPSYYQQYSLLALAIGQPEARHVDELLAP